MLAGLWLGLGLAVPSQVDAAVALGTVQLEGIARWRDDARAAYTIVHDDVCDPSVAGIESLAIPALERRGLKVGLAAIAEACEENHRWRFVKQAARSGHEIASHSFSHAHLTADNAEHEIAGAKAVFEAQLRKAVDFYVFAFDEFTPATVDVVKKAGYLGTRAGFRNDNDGGDNPPISPADPVDDFAVEFDVWPHAYSKYSLFQGTDLLNVHVWNAIDRGGWAMRELHSVMPDDADPAAHGFGPVKLKTYEAHLDFLVAAQRAGLLWVDTPSAVLRYRHARTACRVDARGATLRFDASHPDCARFATPVSVIVTTRADLPGLRASQKGKRVPVTRLAPGRWSVTADPTRGDVALSGRSGAEPGVPAPVDAPPRPAPAASVCDIESDLGPGGLRLLDDFQKPADTTFLHASTDVYNPSHWSWYPPQPAAEPLAVGDAVALRYAGGGIGAWRGVTYVFVSRDTIGYCFDAHRHQGIRFRIRGRVEGGDEFAGKIFVSLVTAETRPRAFGGDLKGQGGHFHRIVPVTPEWQTVEIPWDAFARPTWGDTVTLEAPAVAKLQAIDWGIADTVARFEIDLDDVSLY